MDACLSSTTTTIVVGTTSSATSTAGLGDSAQVRQEQTCRAGTWHHNEQGKPKAAAQQGDNPRVWLLALLSQDRREAILEKSALACLP